MGAPGAWIRLWAHTEYELIANCAQFHLCIYTQCPLRIGISCLNESMVGVSTPFCKTAYFRADVRPPPKICIVRPSYDIQ